MFFRPGEDIEKNGAAAGGLLAGRYSVPAEAAQPERSGSIPGAPAAPIQAHGAERPPTNRERRPVAAQPEPQRGESATGGGPPGQGSGQPGGGQSHHT